MSKFQCPLCRVGFEGSIWDITPQIIGHSDGSHKILYTEEDARRIVTEQADPNFQQVQTEEVMSVSTDPSPTTSPSTSPSTTETDVNPEVVVPVEAIIPPLAPETDTIETLKLRDKSVDAWWDKILKK